MGTARDTWSRLIARHGRDSDLVRIGSPDVSVTVPMMRRYAEEEKLTHEISQQDAWFIVEYTELVAAGFPVPPRKGDRVFRDGEYFTVNLCEPKEAHREMVGYQLRCTGG